MNHAREMCDGLTALEKHDRLARLWEQAVGVHECYHGRAWDLNGDEAALECSAIRHWKVGARLLGATADEVRAVWPIALAFHYRLVAHFPEYHSATCQEPCYYPPGGPRRK